MGYYINAEIGYYEGDRISLNDQEVPQRPDAFSAWDGAQWVADTKQKARADLAQLDTDNALTQRNLRGIVLILAEALKAGGPVDLTVLPGVQKVAAVEADAAVLREKLK